MNEVNYDIQNNLMNHNERCTKIMMQYDRMNLDVRNDLKNHDVQIDLLSDQVAQNNQYIRSKRGTK